MLTFWIKRDDVSKPNLCDRRNDKWENWLYFGQKSRARVVQNTSLPDTGIFTWVINNEVCTDSAEWPSYIGNQNAGIMKEYSIFTN